ncbi:MAG TPA: phytanoyl-CoA dioxygenase family protein [Gammaproteobacteria bacterium]|nr:phytanoyl-CoA dioxygenase family protein [Gammaproteobacteria bacterium]
MTATDAMYQAIAAQSQLPADVASQLRDAGFVVIPGPATPGGIEGLSEAYDYAVATADAADVRVSSSTRVTDFVNRGPEFDGIYVFPPLLAACCLIIGRPFKLSGTRARTLEPGAPVEALHVDVKPGADGWPIVGFIMMVDVFDAANGATRFVPGSHSTLREPGEFMSNPTNAHEEEVVAGGPAGSIIIFDASVWHSHTANRSGQRRRSIQGHFVPRDARASVDHAARMRPEVLGRIGNLAKYVLAVG